MKRRKGLKTKKGLKSRKPLRRRSKSPLTKLEDKAWRIFSEYIRIKSMLKCKCGKRFTPTRSHKKYCSRPCFIKYREYKGFGKGDLNPSRNPIRREEIRRERSGKPLTHIQKKRIGISLRKTLKDPSMRKKWSEAQVGRKLSQETIAKIKKTKSLSPKKVSTLIKQLDTVYSRYIRSSNIGKDGLIPCFTCGKRFPFGEMDCGHYISRMYKSTRFLPKNTQPQCRRCNRFMDGEKDVYAINLIKKYGNGILKELNSERKKIKQWQINELEDLIKKYKIKNKEFDR